MTPIERIVKVRCNSPTSDWQAEDFRSAMCEAQERWKSIEELFEVEYPLLGDAIAEIEPDFELDEVSETTISESAISKLCLGRRIAISYVKWDQCQRTDDIDNPFEPLIKIYEHGGYVNKEHGQFIDVFDADGMPVGGMMVRRA